MDTTHSCSESQLIEERLTFARNTNNDETLERTLQQRGTLDLQPKGRLAHEPHSTCFRTSPKQESNKVIRFRKLKPLGRGNQGRVYEVVDMDTNAHYACKIVDVGKVAAEWKNYTGKDYQIRLKWEVEMVRNMTHPHVVPYTHIQDSEFSPYVQIFMPVYRGDLHDLLRDFRERGLEEVQAMIGQMLHQMFQALDFLHSHKQPVIHRDVKPANILYRGDNFFLTDFGIAKVVDTSNTFIGSGPYMAPEVRKNREQTPKIDIWALGVTVVECLEKPKDFSQRRQSTNEEQWYEYLQTILNQHRFYFASMVSVDTCGRPTARELLQNWPADAIHLGSAAPPLSPQPSGTTATNSASPVLMDQAQTVSTRLVQPTEHDESLQLSQPKPAVIASLDMPPSPRARHGESVMSGRPGKRKRSYDWDSPLLPPPKRFRKA